jgi:hypothetical protein
MSTPTKTHAVYAVRARTEGEVVAHCVTRHAFLGHVIADTRTRALFEVWGHSTGLDAAVAELSARLDTAALQAGLAHRSALHGNVDAFSRVPIAEHTALGHLEHYIARLLALTRDERAFFAMGFVIVTLYGTVVDEEVPIRAWLAEDLLTIFDAEITCHIWGERGVRMQVSRPPTTRDVVPKGQRPKRQGEHLARNAGWYYRAHVAVPKTSAAVLAEEWRAARAAEGVTLAPKNSRELVAERADTKAVRAGIRNAKRLLELPVPPERWSQYFKIS